MKIFLSFIVVMFFVACSYRPEIEKSQSATFVFKTKKVKLSDAGFIRSNNNYINVQIFTAGNLVLDLQINEDICLNGPCYKREYFNTLFFGRLHYPNFLDDLLHFQPIYEKKNLKITVDGFSQTLHVNGDELSYMVDKSGMVFRDRAKKILIKIRNIGETK